MAGTLKALPAPVVCQATGEFTSQGLSVVGGVGPFTHNAPFD